MVVGILTFEIHLPASGSLKGKRQVLRSLKDRLRTRFNVALAEAETHADLWQRAELAIVSVASRREALARLFEEIERECATRVPGHLIGVTARYVHAEDGPPDDPYEDGE